MNVLFVGNGFDKAHSINIEFNDFVNSAEFRKEMKSYYWLFSDEKYIELCKNTKLWSGLENYCELITNNLNINKKIFYRNLSRAFIKWFGRVWLKTSKLHAEKNTEILSFIKNNKYQAIFSYNYTFTSTIYGYEAVSNNYKDTWKTWTIDSIKNKLINLHYCTNKENMFIIGSDKEKNINKNFLIKNWGKKEMVNHKSHYFDLLLKDKKIEQIDFYGFSFGESDINTARFAFDFFNRGGIINIYDLNIKSIRDSLNLCLRGRKGIVKFLSRINYIELD